MLQEKSPDEDQITITRAKFDAITIYEISEDELDTIERGSPSSNYLNFALVLLSTFISFVASLMLTDIQGRTFTFFVVIAVVTGIIGTVLMILWWSSKKDSSRIFKKIRSRKNVEKVREVINIESGEIDEQETI